MDFTCYMPTKTVCGRGCVRREGALMGTLGRHALIVTGKSSKSNGALADVCAALAVNGQRCTVFDGVTPNPTPACVAEGIALLDGVGADFVVGVGGGSPMDAAKAVALLAAERRSPAEIFAGNYGSSALPVVCIPTTAGTGSEVTPYAILTNDAERTKTNLSSPAIFPRIAYLDGGYTDALPPDVTANTAMDALSHAAESILKQSSSPASEMFARESLRILYPLLRSLESPSKEVRDALLWASCLAGMAIAQTGTTVVHGMGYFLTYEHGIAHGRANGLLLGEALCLCERQKVPALEKILSACGDSLKGLCGTLSALLKAREELPENILRNYASRTMHNKNINKCAFLPTEEDIFLIFSRSVGKRN